MSELAATKERMATFSFVEDAAIIEAIDEIARRDDLTRSQVIRRALRLFLSLSPVHGTIQPIEHEVAK